MPKLNQLLKTAAQLTALAFLIGLLTAQDIFVRRISLFAQGGTTISVTRLTANASTTSTTPVNLTDLEFAVSANTNYVQNPCQQKLVPIAAWRVYYSDRMVTSRTTTWEKAPDDDVQVAVFYYAAIYERWNNGVNEKIHYRKICQGVDYYWYGGRGAVEEATAQQVKRGVKRGRWTTDAKWDAIIKAAEAEERLP